MDCTTAKRNIFFLLLIIPLALTESFILKVIQNSKNVEIGTKVTVMCIANGTVMGRIPGARFVNKNGLKWNSTKDGRIQVNVYINLFTYVEYLSIKWDPILEEDKEALSGEGNRCETGDYSEKFGYDVKERKGARHQFFYTTMIASALVGLTFIIMLLVLVLRMRGKRAFKHKKLVEFDDDVLCKE